MRKIMNWVLAATLICGASVFTSCTANDTNDNPSQEQAKKDRKEFIQHTRQNLKDCTSVRGRLPTSLIRNSTQQC